MEPRLKIQMLWFTHVYPLNVTFKYEFISFSVKYCIFQGSMAHWAPHVSDSVTKNIVQLLGKCPTWFSPCRIYVAPSAQRRKVWLTPTTRVPSSNAAKTRKLLKLEGVPETRQQISAVSSPKFTILWGHVEEALLFNNFFPIVDTCLSSKDTARQSCEMVPKWRLLRPVFSASSVQRISDMHSKFALRPHHVWKYGRHPISDRWD